MTSSFPSKRRPRDPFLMLRKKCFRSTSLYGEISTHEIRSAAEKKNSQMHISPDSPDVQRIDRVGLRSPSLPRLHLVEDAIG